MPHLGLRVGAHGVETPVKWPPFATFGTPEGHDAGRDEKISLADQIRDKVDAGVLPRVLPEKLWNAYGRGSPCHGCDQPIHPAQTQYGFFQESGDVIRLHIGCLGLWLAELRRLGLLTPNGTL